MSTYDDDARPTSAPKAARRRRRYSVQAWTGLRTEIDREHRELELADPNSPRIRPSVGPVGWVLK